MLPGDPGAKPPLVGAAGPWHFQPGGDAGGRSTERSPDRAFELHDILESQRRLEATLESLAQGQRVVELLLRAHLKSLVPGTRECTGTGSWLSGYSVELPKGAVLEPHPESDQGKADGLPWQTEPGDGDLKLEPIPSLRQHEPKLRRGASAGLQSATATLGPPSCERGRDTAAYTSGSATSPAATPHHIVLSLQPQLVDPRSDADMQIAATSDNMMQGNPSFCDMREMTSITGQEAESVDTDWPASVKLRAEFQVRTAARPLVEATTTKKAVHRSASAAELPMGAQASNKPGRGRKRRKLWWLLRDPESPLHYAILLLSLLVLVHDLVIIPLVLAWDLKLTGYFRFAILTSAAFWTVETTANLLRGGGAAPDSLVVEATPTSGCRPRYLRTWFVLDLAIVSCDWLAIGLSESPSAGDHGSMVRLAKLGRLFRVAGAVRALRLLSSMQMGGERFLSDSAREVMGVVWLAVFGLWACHLVACGWFAVGTYAPTNTGNHWVNVVVDPAYPSDIEFIDLEPEQQYVTAFNFAVLQMTLAGNNVPPSNVAEEIFQIFTVFAGFVCGSILISALSAKLVEFETTHRERSENLRLLRRYLRENAVPPRVATHVLTQASGRLARPAWLREESVPVLGHLSVTLLAKLRCAICQPHLVVHPLFRLFASMDEGWFEQLVNDAMVMMFLSPGDELFTGGRVAEAAYRVVAGSLVYAQDMKSSPVGIEMTQRVGAGSFASEGALWSEWTHVGTLYARALAKAIAIRADAFIEVLQRQGAIWDIAQAYGRAYHHRVVAAVPPLREWPDDLQVPSTDFAVLTYDMPHEISRMIAMQALESRWGDGLTGKRAREWAEEVESGKSAVIQDEQGRILRVTSVVTLEVRRESDGKVLWQVGRFEDDVGKPDIGMPGGKREKGELADVALERLLRSKLPRLAGKLQVHGLREEVTEKESAAFRCNTRYLRTVYLAILRGDLAVENFEELDPSTVRLPTLATGASSDRLPSLPDKFRAAPVFALQAGKRRAAYAWLLPNEVEELQTSSGQEILAAWMASLRPPAGEVPNRPEEEEAPANESPPSLLREEEEEHLVPVHPDCEDARHASCLEDVVLEKTII